jgi:hypothetical protein
VVCSAPTQNGVVLIDGATLQLNGHSISGGTSGIVCSTRCVIEGPGEIAGFSEAGITTTTNPRPKLTVSGDVSVHDNLHYGLLLSYDAKLGLSDVTISNNNFGGITFSPTGVGDKGKLKGFGVTVTGNNGPGIDVKKFKLEASTVQGNDGNGVLSQNGGGVLIDSAVIGNGTDFDPSYDLKTLKPPRLRNSSCELSGRFLKDGSLSGTWAVCSED